MAMFDLRGIIMVGFTHEITVEDYNNLRQSVGWNKIEARQAAVGLQNSSFKIAAVENGQTIGFARTVSDGGYVVIIVDVIVLPAYQGRGVGRRLLEGVMTNIREKLEPGQGVMVNLMAAKDKEPFYLRFGFTARPNDSLGCGMTQWIQK